MSRDKTVTDRIQLKSDGPDHATSKGADSKEKALALGLDFARRAFQANNLDELFFVLTNDLRILAEFDRALLITHIGGKSDFVSATNQPVLEKKQKFFAIVNELAAQLHTLERGIWLSSDETAAEKLEEQGLASATRDQLLSFMQFSGCSFLLCVPLVHQKGVLGHILLEFHGNIAPNQVQILTLLSIAPFLASALAEKWLMDARPTAWKQILPGAGPTQRQARLVKRLVVAGILAVLAVCALFFVTVSYTVGGESEIVPKEKHLAFAQIDGLVQDIKIAEGSRVVKGQVLASLDRTEIDHEIKTTTRQLDILTKEALLLRRQSGEDPSKLAESAIVELKRRNTWEELTFLKAKSRFLQIRAPVSGIVVTKDIDSLVGKRFSAGETFCEIAVPGGLWITVHVPEDKISLVQAGQSALLYLNSRPDMGFRVYVAEIAPVAEVLPRMGNTYRVRAPFPEAPEHVRVGMKGIGKIFIGELTPYQIIRRRFVERWNQLSIYF